MITSLDLLHNSDIKSKSTKPRLAIVTDNASIAVSTDFTVSAFLIVLLVKMSDFSINLSLSILASRELNKE